jgi:hypothetical protein
MKCDPFRVGSKIDLIPGAPRFALCPPAITRHAFGVKNGHPRSNRGKKLDS